MEQKYGFVYIWFDRKHKRYYVGCHWGRTDDSYICSSTWMRNTYRRRPHDFKRRIIETNIPRELLFEREYVWLKMIRDEELGARYYNLHNRLKEHWSTNTERRLTVSEKIGDVHRGKTVSEETREKIRKANLGKKMSDSSRQKMSVSRTGIPKSMQTREKMRESASRQFVSEETRTKIGDIHRGKTVSEETREKIRVANLGKKLSEKTKEKMRESYRQRNKRI